MVQQRHVNAWKVIQYLIEPRPGRTNWGLFIASVGERFKKRVASFVRAENARAVTLQVNSHSWDGWGEWF